MFEILEAILHILFYRSLLIGLACGAIVAALVSWFVFGEFIPAPICIVAILSAFGSYAYFEWPKKEHEN